MKCPQCNSDNLSKLSWAGDVTCLDCNRIFDVDEGVHSMDNETLFIQLRARLQDIAGLDDGSNDHIAKEFQSLLLSATALAAQCEELLDDIEAAVGDVIGDLQTL